jgi:tetratricopeptide (TPR) repeat protein
LLRTFADKPTILSFIIFLIFFFLYLSTLCPNLYWRDAGEFQAVAYQLGITHPAGSPFYVLVTKIFTFLPFGSIAFKVNLASAFFGAVLICLIFLLINECLKWIFPSHHNKLWRVVSGALAASLYAVSNSLWQNSIVAEVYTLQNCFIVLIALLLVRGIKQTEKKSCLYLAGFLFGLSAGAHIIMILYIPALLLFLWLFYRNSIRLSHLGIIIMFVILGASIYLYLPVRSSVNPYYDWGNPENVKNFIVHVTDKKDAKVHFFFSPKKFSQTLRQYGKFFYDDFGILGIVLGLIGIGVFFKKNPRLFFGLGAFFFSQWPFFIRYWKMPSAYIGTFLFFTLAIGVGIFGSTQKLVQLNPFESKKRCIIPCALAIICIIQISLVGCYNFKSTTRSGYWSPYLFFKQLFDSIDARGILISKFYYFGTTYLQQCENYRADITNMNLNDFLNTQLFGPLDSSKYPLIQIPQKTKSCSLTEIINANYEKQLFYFEPSWDVVCRINKNLKPEGILLSLSSSPYQLTAEIESFNLQKTRNFFARLIPDGDQYNDYEERDVYGQTLESLGIFFYKNLKAYKLSIAYLALAYELDPHVVNVLNGLSSCYLKIIRYPEAERYAKETLDIQPSNSVTLDILGQIYLATGRYTSAFWCYQKALETDPHNREAYFGIGRYFTKLGNTNQAHEAFQKVINLSKTNDALALAAKKEITTKGN